MVSKAIRKKVYLHCLLCLLAGIAVFAPAYAAPPAVTLSGTVKAASGSPVSNVQISVMNTVTGAVASPAMGPDGAYKVSGLAAGTYQVTASAPGFAQSSLTVTIQDGSASTADLVLQQGSAENNALTETEKLGSDEGMSAKAISDLPLNGRSATDAAALEPGVMKTRTQSSNGNNGFGTQMAIFGGRPRQNSSRLNGISVNDYANGPLGNATGFTLGVDGLEQLTVMTRNDQPEFGISSGGYISSATRSGTTKFHGSGFEFLRDSHLDATDFFASKKPALRRNQFGGSVGGPIFSDHWLFFTTYEGIRQAEDTVSLIVTPSTAARAGLLCSTPKSGASCAPTVISVDPEVKRYLDAFYPVPPDSNLLGTGDTGYLDGLGPRNRSGNHVTGRIDYKPTEEQSLYGVYTFENGSDVSPDKFSEKLFGNVSRQQYFTIGHSYSFTPKLLNSFRFGLYRMSVDAGFTTEGPNPLSGDPSFAFVPGRPHGQVNVPGISQLGNGLGGPDRYLFHWTSFQAYDDVSVIRGTHSLKFGVAIERTRNNIFATAITGGHFSFNSLTDFLTNKPFSFVTVLPGSDAGHGFRQTIAGAYIQDNWAARRNVNLSFGLRYEIATVPSEVNDHTTALLNLTDPAPQTGRALFDNPTLHNFAPRVGFAWDPLRTGFLTISSGFGVFDVLPLPYEVQSSQLFSAPFYVTGSATNVPAGSFPTGAYSIASTTATGFAQAYFEPHPKRNYVMQWNYTTQWRLPRDFSVKVGYVGSRGVHNIFRVKDANMILPTLTSAGYLWPVPGAGTRLNPQVGPITAAFWNGDSHYNAFVLQVRKQIGRGAQVGGSYTLGKSIDTSSGSIDGDEYSNAISSPLWFDTRTNRGQSDFDITHSLKITYSWQLPSPRLDFRPVGWAMDGWQLGGVLEASSGIPFTPGLGGDPLGVNSTDTNVDVPSVVAGPGCESLINPGNPNHYIKTECLQVPRTTPAIAASCVHAVDPSTNAPDLNSCLNLRGSLGRNTLTGPGLFTVNFTVFKNNFVRSVSDAFNVQFRAEFFNLLNRPNFNAPLENRSVFDSKGNALANGGFVQSTQGGYGPRNIQLAIRMIW